MTSRSPKSRTKAPVSRVADEATIVDAAPPAPAPAPIGSQEPSLPDDVPMPTVENEPPYTYAPQAGCGILDNFEILMTYLMFLTGQQQIFPKGTFRGMQIPAASIAQLSDSALRHMRQAPPPAPPEVPTAPPT